MIEVIDLEKHFGDNEVLKGINVTVDKGDIMVVIGPSGSGKSTFLRCLNCMEDPTGGQIIFNGVDIADPKVDINIHRRRMGMVFQHFNLYNNKTVIQNIMLAPVYVQCQDLKKAKRHNRVPSAYKPVPQGEAGENRNHNDQGKDRSGSERKSRRSAEENRTVRQGRRISVYTFRRTEAACGNRACTCNEPGCDPVR